MDQIDKKRQGRLNRKHGREHEVRIRKELESQGWIVDRWSNNIDLKTRKIVKAKNAYNPFKKTMSLGTGFPDFICLKKTQIPEDDCPGYYKIMFVECKLNGTTTKEEKEKMKVLSEIMECKVEVR